MRRGKSAPCWQPVVDGDGVGPDHDILSTKALTRRTAEAVRWLWLFRMPPCMMCRWCGSGRNMELACEGRAWSQARKPAASRKPRLLQHNTTARFDYATEHLAQHGVDSDRESCGYVQSCWWFHSRATAPKEQRIDREPHRGALSASSTPPIEPSLQHNLLCTRSCMS